MPAIRTILVAIKDPDSKTLPSIAKAARLAEAFDAKLILFHAINDLIVAGSYLYGRIDIERLRRDRMAGYQKRLEAIAERLRERGLEVAVSAAWDYPPHEAIVRRAQRLNADLIVAECHAGRRLAPWLLHLTDWELLRTSPVPVLLVKCGATWSDLNVLAAIDPSHRFGKPAKLDSRILTTAATFSGALGGTLHVAHCYVAVPAGTLPMAGSSGLLVRQIAEGAEAQAKESLRAAVASTPVPRSRQHLVQGSPVETIPRLAQELGCGLVVMGAISRSGLKRAIIGNTAERILNNLAADVLVVKPLEFKSRVAPRGRGMHVVGLPTVGTEL